MLMTRDVLAAKVLIQLGLASPEPVRRELRAIDADPQPGRDLLNRLAGAGALDERQVQLVRHRVALYEHVRNEASYVRLLERHASVRKTTVAEMISGLERTAFRRRLGDVLVAQGLLKKEQDSFIVRKLHDSVDREDAGILDRYRREDFAGITHPLIARSSLEPSDFKISTLFRSKETQALVSKADLEAARADAIRAAQEKTAPLSVDEASGRVPLDTSGRALPSRSAVPAPEETPAAGAGGPPLPDATLLEPPPARVARPGAAPPASAGDSLPDAIPLAPGTSPPERRAHQGPDSVRSRKRIADYEIIEVLGVGGMGAVYLAQKAGREYVAIKVLLDQAASKAERGRFRREIQLTRSVEHHNVIGIIDSGVTPDGLTYLVVPALAGKELRAHLEAAGASGLPPEVACLIMERILEGMQAVHERGVVHRDLKPENVFVLAGGAHDLKIMDFGLAKLQGEAAPAGDDYFHSAAGEVLGSPPYIAPESISSDPIDGRTDIYSLGVMFFEMLTGRLPIESETTGGFLTAHLIAPPLALADAAPARAWPPRAEQLIARMLGKTRDERPASCQAILDELRGGLRDELVRSAGAPPAAAPAPAPPPPEDKKWISRGLLGRLWNK